MCSLDSHKSDGLYFILSFLLILFKPLIQLSINQKIRCKFVLDLTVKISLKFNIC